MEKLITARELDPFNSPLEVGVRTVIILNEAYPRYYDLPQITWLDHMIVHSSDFGGPPSLHPSVSQRTGEILIRRRLVEDGIGLMRRLHMIDILVQEQGVFYRASDESKSFVELMDSRYSQRLIERARWLAKGIGQLNYQDMRYLVLNKLGSWDVEFDGLSNHERGV